MTRNRRFAALTNFRDPPSRRAAPRSRGLLVSGFLQSNAGAHDYLCRIAREGDRYEDFNLLAADQNALCYYGSRGGAVLTLPAGIYGVSNHLLDTPWPKVILGKAKLANLALAPEPSVAALFELLADRTLPSDDALPDTRIGIEWERLLAPVFIASEAYGTRSCTVVLVRNDGGIIFHERSFGALGAAIGEVRFETQPPVD